MPLKPIKEKHAFFVGETIPCLVTQVTSATATGLELYPII